MMNRLINFYHASRVGMESTMSPIWNFVSAKHQRDLIQALETKDAKSLESVLSNLGPSNGVYGLELMSAIRWSNSYCVALLETLAIRTGVFPMANPDQLSPTLNQRAFASLDIVRKCVEDALGFSLKVPDCFGFDGDKNDGIPAKFFHYAANVYTVKEFLGRFPDRILEIGGGLGNLVIIAQRLGSKSYTVIDLPFIAVMSAYFASKTIGESNVWLYGEHENKLAFAKYLPSTAWSKACNSDYDLIFNSDSFPEIPESSQAQYVNLIYNQLSQGGIFLSMNHESDLGGQISVRNSIAKYGNGKLRCVTRNPFMLRIGYVEEIWVKA